MFELIAACVIVSFIFVVVAISNDFLKSKKPVYISNEKLINIFVKEKEKHYNKLKKELRNKEEYRINKRIK